MAPKDIGSSSLETINITFCGKDFANVTKALEMGPSSWIVWWTFNATTWVLTGRQGQTWPHRGGGSVAWRQK